MNKYASVKLKDGRTKDVFVLMYRKFWDSNSTPITVFTQTHQVTFPTLGASAPQIHVFMEKTIVSTKAKQSSGHWLDFKVESNGPFLILKLSHTHTHIHILYIYEINIYFLRWFSSHSVSFSGHECAEVNSTKYVSAYIL